MMQHGAGRHQVEVSRLDPPRQDVFLTKLQPGYVRVDQGQVQIYRHRPPAGATRPASQADRETRYHSQLRAYAPQARRPASGNHPQEVYVRQPRSPHPQVVFVGPKGAPLRRSDFRSIWNDSEY